MSTEIYTVEHDSRYGWVIMYHGLRMDIYETQEAAEKDCKLWNKVLQIQNEVEIAIDNVVCRYDIEIIKLYLECNKMINVYDIVGYRLLRGAEN